MPNRGRKAARAPRSDRFHLSSHAARKLALLVATLVATALCLPRLWLGYFWDDYIFLTASQANPLAFVLPNPTTIFYRPISMGLYPLLLLALGPWGSVAGHIFNLVLLALAVVLLATLVARVASFRAGLFAALAYASLSSVPSLVAWTTASNDLFAIVFILVAFHWRHAGHTIGVVAAAACAVFSKETAIALLPTLWLWPWVVGRTPRRLLLHGFLCLGLLAVWAVTHPGAHAFLAHGFDSVATGYVRMGHPERWTLHAGRYLVTLFNLPLTGYHTPWPSDLTMFALVALALLFLALWLGRSGITHEDSHEGLTWGRGARLAALIVIPPLALQTVLIGHFAPYYASLPGIGGAILIGLLLSRVRYGVAAVCLALYVILGVWCRGIEAPGELAFTERGFVESSRAIRLVEGRFRELRPTLPRGAELLVSVGQTGTLGITQTLHQGQAPRVWYGDPSLVVLPPEQRTTRGQKANAEYLFRITGGLDLIEIDPDRCLYRTSGAHPHPDQIGRTIRTYARGAASSGEVDRAERILIRLADFDGDLLRSYDIRLAAMMRLSQGRIAGAESLIAATSPLPREFALDMVGKIFADPSRSPEIDSLAFRAFEVSSADTAAIRYLMQVFERSGYRPQALEFARRLERLVPGDAESARLIRVLDLREDRRRRDR